MKERVFVFSFLFCEYKKITDVTYTKVTVYAMGIV